MFFSKFNLIEKTIKVKFLSSLLNQSKKSAVFFLIETKMERQPKAGNFISSPHGKLLSISNKFLRLLTSRNSLLKWNWLKLLQGPIKIYYNFDFFFDIHNFLKRGLKSKNFLILGGYIRQFFFSRNSLDWLVNNFRKVLIVNNDLRLSFILHFIFLLSHFYTYLYRFCISLFFKIIKKLENLKSDK